MYYTAKQILEGFIKGKLQEGKTNNGTLRIEEGQLINYNACIALRGINEEYGYIQFVINSQKYSKTTTGYQNRLIQNSVHFNKAVLIIQNEQKFVNYCYEKFEIIVKTENKYYF